MTKLVEFKYTKAGGSISDRALVVLQEPAKNYAGIDVSQLDNDEFADFTRDLQALKTRQHEEILQLMHNFDLTYNYRQFIPENMSDVVKIIL